MPTSWAFSSTSGPPELPGLMTVSVRTTFWYGPNESGPSSTAPNVVDTVDTSPLVAVSWARVNPGPNALCVMLCVPGYPTATTWSPTLRSFCDPRGRFCRPDVSLTWMTPMSSQFAAPRIFAVRPFGPALNVSPTSSIFRSSPFATVTFWLSARTCALVTMMPLLESQTQPVPRPTRPPPWSFTTNHVEGLTLSTI